MNDNLIETIASDLQRVKDMGWVPTQRAGNTGVGYTLETLLNIKENNLQEPDLHGIELKSYRKNNNSMMTLFTLSPAPARSNTHLREQFGYLDAQTQRKTLHTTLTMARNTTMNSGSVLGLQHVNEAIHITHLQAGTTVLNNIFWNKERLEKAFNKKIKDRLICVSADSQGAGKDEMFFYNEAFLFSGFDFDRFVDLLKEGRIYIDIRIGQYSNGKTHDHGTAFRIKQSDRQHLFKQIDQIL